MNGSPFTNGHAAFMEEGVSGYNNKEIKQDEVIDASPDVRIFANGIRLINQRFPRQ